MMLKPGITVTSIVAIELTDTMLVLRMRTSDGGVAATWWPLSEMVAFLTPTEEIFAAEPTASMQ